MDIQHNPEFVDVENVPLTPELHVRKQLDLRVTVTGRRLEDLIIDLVNSGEEITIGSEAVTLNVSNISRYDGLPLGVEKMFEVWFKASGLRDSLKETAKISYLNGMLAGGVGFSNNPNAAIG